MNLFGDLWAWTDARRRFFDRALSVPGTRLFLYGKSGARAGRKMGHIAASANTPQLALDAVQRAFSLL